MEDTANNIPQDVWNRIRQLILGKEYGSVEIYIEAGEVVQITDRTISKLKRTGPSKVPGRLIRPVKNLRF